MKSQLRGKVFDNRDNLEATVRHTLMWGIKREVYRDAMRNMIQRWRKCVILNGDYVERVSVDVNDMNV
jgi:hypothetical protein